MPKLLVQSFSMSLDGYGAGPDQSLDNPLGVRGPELMEWFFPTDVWKAMHGLGEGEKGVDNGIAEQGFSGIGAWILGRNMFGPGRGPWPDDSWKGWWGDNPPYPAPTFVLTHYQREPIVMEGGTTFYFVTGGIEEALDCAKKAAGTKDIKIGGGGSPGRHYLRARLIDSLHIASVPILLGLGEALFHGLDLRGLGFSVTDRKISEYATHLTLERA